MSAEWEKSWRDHISDLPVLGGDIHYNDSAERLRRLLVESPFRQTDLKNDPRKFFLTHATLGEIATHNGPGFGIRFTVQFNLFAGTILALGGKKQVESLDTMQDAGKLGCFCLTERFAGVNSGLVVDTTCEWNEAKQMFLLDCPDGKAHKNWISQGLTADMAVVIATLIVKGKSYGPHGFVMELRRSGKDGKRELVPGVTAEDMGSKTIGNDLDNARIAFSKVWLPKEALLNRHADVVDNAYVKADEKIQTMDMIGQRLYTGRTVIAASTLIFARTLFASSRKYADSKECWHPKEKLTLSQVPQIADTFQQGDVELTKVEKLLKDVENRLADCLIKDRIPDKKLVEMVSVLKVKAIETSIKHCFSLKQELGSYALMSGTGFEKMDYLQCCKFAEGDSRILMQKMARDRLQAFAKKQEGSDAEVQLCMTLGGAMKAGGAKAWNDNWRLVYDLAAAVMDRVVDEANGAVASKL